MKFSLMRAMLAVVCLGGATLAGGCFALSPQRLHELQFFDGEAFQRDEAAVYQACRDALEAMNYSYVRGSRADGKLEMAANVNPRNALLARQRRAVLEVKPGAEGGTVVRIGFWEAHEERSLGGTVTAGSRLIKEPALYQAYWERMDTALKAIPAATPAPAASAPTAPAGP